MSKKVVFGILLGAAGLTLACLCTSVNIVPLRWTPTAVASLAADTWAPNLEPAGTMGASLCVENLTKILHDSETIYLPGAELETDFTLVTYSVSGNAITDPVNVYPIPPKLKAYQDDTAAQQKLWDFFADVIPTDQRTEVTQFTVFTDGPNNSLGAVEQTDDPRYWKLEMDIQDGQNFPALSSTLVHEFGHLLTLNESQVTPDMQVFNHPNDQGIYDSAAANCSTYFMFEGCSRPDSYINRFFQRFWPSLFAEWQQIDSETDPDLLDQKLDKLYEQHRDEFLSNYAITSPEEDVAETFMYFIFTPRPAGTMIADQKVLFFYGYPAMVRLREQILSHLCLFVEKP